MATGSGIKPIIEVQIADKKFGNLQKNLIRFDWKSMVNGGFIVKCTLIDPNFSRIDKIIDDDQATYLRNGVLWAKTTYI